MVATSPRLTFANNFIPGQEMKDEFLMGRIMSFYAFIFRIFLLYILSARFTAVIELMNFEEKDDEIAIFLAGRVTHECSSWKN